MTGPATATTPPTSLRGDVPSPLGIDAPPPRILIPVAISLVNVALAALLGALTAMDLTTAMTVGLVAAVVLAIALRPNFATFVVLAILYSNAAAIAVQIHGWAYPIAALLPLILIIPLAYQLVVRHEPVVMTPALRLILLLFVAELVSTVLSRDPGNAVEALFKYAVEGVFLVAAVTNVVRDLSTVRYAVWLLLFVGAGLGLLSAYQQATGSYDNDFLGFAQVSRALVDTGPTGDGIVTGEPRLAGPIGEKNRYAQILVVLLPLAFTRMWDERSRLLRLLAAVLAGAISVGIALTFSRGAALGFGLMVVIMVALRYIGWRQLVAVGLGAALLLTMFPTYGARLLTIESITGATSTGGEIGAADDSIRSRANEMLAATLAFAEHPIVGVGPGLFPAYYPRYAGQIGIKVEHSDRQAHNLFVGIAAELGIVGLTLFLGIVWVVMRDLVRARRRLLATRPDIANLATGFALAIVAYLATGLFLHLAFERYYWLLIGLAAATAWIALREGTEPAEDAGTAPAGRARTVRAATPGTA
jgi:putative inorganic carbon (hco3(-)) transporter